MTIKRNRAVAAVRLSAYAASDNTTSPTRQREADIRAAQHLGLDIVGWAEDLNVSASKVSPFDRPELGGWLRRPAEFDALIFWRLDRAVRSMADMAELARWAKQHSKRLIFAEGPSGGIFELDMGSPFGELIMLLLAFAAQMEAQAIQERVSGARAALRGMTRWPGGQPPYGYQLCRNPEGKGYLLEHDPVSSAAVQRMASWVLEGRSLAEVARRLTLDPVTPAPRDHIRRRNGRTEEGVLWHDSAVRYVLTSPAVMGYLLHRRKPILDPEGNPRVVGPPILDRATHGQVVEAIEGRRPVGRAPRKDTRAMLLGVAFCGSCGERMYLHPPAKGRAQGKSRYTCKGKARGGFCSAKPSMRADWLEDYVEREYLKILGDADEVVFISHGGYDPRPELEEVRIELAEHLADRELFKSDTGRREWRDRTAALEARAARLEATPVTPPAIEERPTGRTHGDAWHATKDSLERRALLLNAGARVEVHPGIKGGHHKRRNDDRLKFALGMHAQPMAEARQAIRWEELS